MFHRHFQASEVVSLTYLYEEFNSFSITPKEVVTMFDKNVKKMPLCSEIENANTCYTPDTTIDRAFKIITSFFPQRKRKKQH